MTAILLFLFLSISSGCISDDKAEEPSKQDGQAGLAERKILPGAFQMEEYLPALAGTRVGLICNKASVMGDQHLLDTLLKRGIHVSYLFAPEHGFRASADAGETVHDDKDPITGIPIISLYGKQKGFPLQYLDSVDLLVFDLQDVGVRFFTYINNLYEAMEACSQSNVPLIILDRPNPNGYYVDGPMLEKEFVSGVGKLPIPVVYGLTIGELALMINGEGWLKDSKHADIRVIACLEYDHNMTYDLPVRPSPNLPNLRSILLYPSLCFFEGTTLSIGRGTERQFQVIGHPSLSEMPFQFTPQSMPGAKSPKHEGVQCQGISLEDFQPEEIMRWKKLNLQYLIDFYRSMDSDQTFFLENHFIDLLAGTDQLRKEIIEGKSEAEIREGWKSDLESFKEKRKKYLLYPDFTVE